MNRQNSRRTAFKAWHPHWKEKFRENCLRRVKKDRHQLLWKIRSSGKPSHASKEVAGSAFSQIITEEIDRLQQTNGVQESFAGTDNDRMLWEYESPNALLELDQEDYEELMMAMESILHDELQTEREEKEAALLKEYEDSCRQEENSLTSLLDQLQHGEEGLLCPICKAGYLHQIQHVIYCSCGRLRLDVQNEKVNLNFLRGRLEEILQQHQDLGCKSQPVFCTENIFSVTALYMQCRSCDTFELVL